MPHFSLEILVDTRGALENLTSDMRFEDIPGKSDVKNQLRSNVQRGRIPHAQIFLGREGSGALPLAMAFAAYILCENRSETDSCGQCRQCLKSYKLIHPDLHFSFPVVKSGDKKRADTTSDDQLQLPAAQAEQIANLSDGNMQYALQVGKNEASDYSDLLIAWLRVAYKSDPAEINQWIAAFSELSKDEQKNFLHYGLHFFRQYLWLTLVQGDKAKLTAKEIEIASRMHKLLDFELAEKLISLLENMVSNLPRNVNVKIMLFADSLQMGEILRQKKSA